MSVNFFAKSYFPTVNTGNQQNAVVRDNKDNMVVNDDQKNAKVEGNQQNAIVSVLPSNALMQQALFSETIEQRDRDRLQKIQTLIESSVGHILDNREKLNKAINDFRERAGELNDKCQQFAIKACDEEMSDTLGQRAAFLVQLAKQVSDRYYETATQLSNLTKLAEEQGFAQNKGVIELCAMERLKELEIFSGRVKLLVEGENHELEVMALIHNQQLKQEAQKFDQIMQEKEFEGKKKQIEFDQQMKEKEQKRTEDSCYEELAIKKIQSCNQDELEKMKAENSKTIELEKAKNPHQVEMERIQAEERVKMAKIEAEKCIIS